jgi:deoxyadenosine/deoxycytidine kinase
MHQILICVPHFPKASSFCCAHAKHTHAPHNFTKKYKIKIIKERQRSQQMSALYYEACRELNFTFRTLNVHRRKNKKSRECRKEKMFAICSDNFVFALLLDKST